MPTKLHKGKLHLAFIARAAREVARREGLDGVTVRAVAAKLGVSPMALYRHIESTDDLRRAALNEALKQVPSPGLEGPVSERLRSWAVEARGVVRRYPGLAEACLREWVVLRHGCRIMELLLGVAADHSSDDAEQVAIANAVFVYVLSRVAAERAVLAGGRRRTLPAVEEEPRRYPRLVRVQKEFMTINVERHFAIGLDALLFGLLRREVVS